MNDTGRSPKGKWRVSRAAFSGWYVAVPIVVAIMSTGPGSRWVLELVGLEVTVLTEMVSGFVVGTVVGTVAWFVLAAATSKMGNADD